MDGGRGDCSDLRDLPRIVCNAVRPSPDFMTHARQGGGVGPDVLLAPSLARGLQLVFNRVTRREVQIWCDRMCPHPNVPGLDGLYLERPNEIT